VCVFPDRVDSARAEGYGIQAVWENLEDVPAVRTFEPLVMGCHPQIPCGAKVSKPNAVLGRCLALRRAPATPKTFPAFAGPEETCCHYG